MVVAIIKMGAKIRGVEVERNKIVMVQKISLAELHFWDFTVKGIRSQSLSSTHCHSLKKDFHDPSP